MILTDERPHIRAICRDGTAWILPMDALADFRATWMAGKTFWSGRCAYGSDVTVKLADVTGLSVWDEARLALSLSERDEVKRRELVDGTA
jgi:hypothetical protein